MTWRWNQFLCTVGLGLALLVVVRGGWAQDDTEPEMVPANPGHLLLSAADESHLWISQAQTGSSHRLLYRNAVVPEGELRELLKPKGHPERLAAFGPRVDVAYEDGSIQSVRFYIDPQTGVHGVNVKQREPLPDDVKLVDMVAGPQGPVVLITTPPPSESDADAEPQGEEPANPGPFQLLRLKGNQWLPIPLPDGLAVARGPQLLGQIELIERDDETESTWPWVSGLMLAEPTTLAGGRLQVYALDKDRWTQRTIDVPEQGRWRVHRINGQLVVSVVRGSESVSGYVLLGEKLEPLGALPLPAYNEPKVATVAWDGQLGAVVFDGTEALAVVTRSLTEGPDADATTTSLRVAPWPKPMINQDVLMMVFLVVAGGVLWMALRRNQEVALVELPAGVMPADVSKRVFAAMIDLVPALGVTMVVYGITDPVRILEHWPNLAGNMELMEPGYVMIGFMVLHCTITEIAIGTSLGKRVLGLRVRNVKGERAKVHWIILRNLVKTIEMIVWLVPLLMMWLSPFRQRMGDHAARTVVLQDTPATAEEASESKPDDTE